MILKMVLAGFGGQGVLSMGQFLACSGLFEDKEVSYLPAYGPEMRGGTANCSVIISDKPVASPLCTTPDLLVAMNTPSLLRFQDRVKKGGIIIVNSSLVTEEVSRTDVKVLKIPANDIAQNCGSSKAANMVMTGVVVEASKIVTDESIYKCIEDRFSPKPKLIPMNEEAFRAGKQAAQNG